MRKSEGTWRTEKHVPSVRSVNHQYSYLQPYGQLHTAQSFFELRDKQNKPKQTISVRFALMIVADHHCYQTYRFACLMNVQWLELFLIRTKNKIVFNEVIPPQRQLPVIGSDFTVEFHSIHKSMSRQKVQELRIKLAIDFLFFVWRSQFLCQRRICERENRIEQQFLF